MQIQQNAAGSMALATDFENTLSMDTTGSQQKRLNADTGIQLKTSVYQLAPAAAGDELKNQSSIQIDLSRLMNEEIASSIINGLISNKSSGNSVAQQGVTFPNEYDDELADILY